MNIIHPHYSLLAARISVNSLHKSTCDTFHETVYKLFHYEDKGMNSSLISEDVYKIVMDNKVFLFKNRIKLKKRLIIKEIILMISLDLRL